MPQPEFASRAENKGVVDIGYFHELPVSQEFVLTRSKSLEGE